MTDLDEFDDTSTFENKAGLADDMRFLASIPELTDITFLVGDTREPVCAVRAVLAARSRVFNKMLFHPSSRQTYNRQKETQAEKTSKFRSFIKRSSEPLLTFQMSQKRLHQLHQLSQGHEGYDPAYQHQTLIIEEFEPDVFRQLIEYIHTGTVTLQPRTLLGLMNAADYYGLDELKCACSGFIQCCITVDTVCALLATAERYIQYKCTKFLIQKVLEFVDDHGNEVLNLGSFALLPQHVVRLILVREELKADEFSKFQAAFMWSKKYSDNHNQPLRDVLGPFLVYIQFHMIPANILMTEIHPLGLVPYNTIMKALAYQADPSSVTCNGPLHRVSPAKAKKHTPRASGRAASVQSSLGLDPRYGSNTTLSSTASSSRDLESPASAETAHRQLGDLLTTHSRCSSVSKFSNHSC